MPNTLPLEVAPNAYRGLIGIARRDATPPEGIYARMWGAATHDFAEGVHRPLTITVLAVQASPDDPVRLLAGVDIAMLGDLGDTSDSERILAPVRDALGLTDGRLLVNCSHTHSSPWAATSRSNMPGGHLISPYLDSLGQALLEAGTEAVANITPATLTWATGACNLAANRDLADPAPGVDRVICGYNPVGHADDTLVVGRVTRDGDGTMMATLVNYACHPTTLAWDNKLISPDYIGAMRELVEQHTAGALCLFLHGASGELGPAHQYVGDAAVADRHGRRLGFSALAAIEGMLPPGEALRYEGVAESGAPLAVWLPAPFTPSSVLAGDGITVPMPLKPMPSVAELEDELAATENRPQRERLFRKIQIVRSLSDDGYQPILTWVWRLGDSLLVAHPNEAYSRFQEDLRAAFPDQTIVVMNTSGATEIGYLYPPELEGRDVYQVWQTPFAADALPALTARCIAEGQRLLGVGA
jgi:hypothetical protein